MLKVFVFFLKKETDDLLPVGADGMSPTIPNSYSSHHRGG